MINSWLNDFLLIGTFQSSQLWLHMELLKNFPLNKLWGHAHWCRFVGVQNPNAWFLLPDEFNQLLKSWTLDDICHLYIKVGVITNFNVKFLLTSFYVRAWTKLNVDWYSSLVDGIQPLQHLSMCPMFICCSPLSTMHCEFKLVPAN